MRASPIDALSLLFGEKRLTIHTPTACLNPKLFHIFFEVAIVVLLEHHQ